MVVKGIAYFIIVKIGWWPLFDDDGMNMIPSNVDQGDKNKWVRMHLPKCPIWISLGWVYSVTDSWYCPGLDPNPWHQDKGNDRRK